jgi:hypothetical protein
VVYSDRLYVESWGGSTAIHGRLVGIEWHELTAEGYGPGVSVETTDDFTHEPDYAYEQTVATKDWLPHAQVSPVPPSAGYAAIRRALRAPSR